MTDAVAPESTPQTPYVGLVPYGEEDADFFFGRDAEKQIVTGNLRASRLTILYGPSGVGKTSLLQAGVVHDLRRQALADRDRQRPRAPFAVCVFRAWRDDPLPALVEAIRTAAEEMLPRRGLPAWEPGRPLTETLRAWTEHVRTLLVVLDQFEDYFLYHSAEDAFESEFPAIVNEPNLRVNFLVSIREDAWAKLDRFEGRIPRLFANYVRVEHLDRAAARQAIERPVEVWNRRLPPGEEPYAVEEALVEAVIAAAAAGPLALAEVGDPAVPESESSDAVEPPFLQLVMERLWRATVQAGSRDVTLSRLRQLGGAQQIVSNHLLEALGTLTPAEQAVAADAFRFLVTRSKTKIAHPASDLADWTKHPEPEVSAVLDKLCRGESGRVLRAVPPPAGGDGGTRYELFHDVLAEPILEWRRAYEQEQARRAAFRRFARVGGLLVSLLAVFAALGIWALVQRSDARHATRSATSLALASAASAQLAAHPDVSLLLGLEANRASPSAQAASSMVAALEVARRSGAFAILRDSRSGVRAIDVSPDGRVLASAGFDGTLRFWDLRTRRPLGQPLHPNAGQIWSVAFSPDGRTLASAGFDGKVRLWDVQRRRQLGRPLDSHAGRVLTVAFSPDGGTLGYAGFDGTVRLWDVRRHRPLEPPLRGHMARIVSLAFSPDGRTLASASFDRTVRLWNLRTRRPLGGPLRGHTAEVVSVAFSPDGRTLASSGLDGSVRLWDVQRRRQLGRPLGGHSGEVWSVAFSPDGRTLACSGFDRTIRLWDVRTHRPVGQPLRGHAERVDGVAFSPDGMLASAGLDGTVRLWDAHSPKLLGEPLRGHADQVKGVAVSPDGRTLASAGYDRTVRLWDIHEGKPIGAPLRSPTDAFEGVAFSPDGRTLAAASDDGSVWLWATHGRSLLGRLTDGHAGAVEAVAFSPDGRTLASAGFDGTVRLWDVRGRRPLGQPLRGHSGQVWSVAFSPDGRTLASAGFDGTVRLWDVHTGRPLDQVLRASSGGVLSVAFSPDGRTLASGAVDGSIRLWDVRAHRPLGQPLSGHVGAVQSVAFSPDGRMLASAGFDGTVRLWDVRGRRPLGQPLRGHSGQVWSVAFSPDGRTLISGGSDRTVRLWKGIFWRDSSDLRAQVCSLVVGNLTKDDWMQLAPGLAYRTTCAS